MTKKCLKDADEGAYNKHDCSVIVSGKYPYACTRPKGHKGKHHAHTLNGYCCAVW